MKKATMIARKSIHSSIRGLRIASAKQKRPEADTLQAFHTYN
jgi:hypothetical protein